MSKENKIKIAVFISALLLVAGFMWRASFDRVGDILEFLPRFQDTDVYLLGRIRSAIAVPFVGSIYKLSDGSGEVWVLSKVDTIQTSQLVFIKGTVKKRLEIEKIDLSRYIKTDVLPLEDSGPVVIEKKRGGFLSSLTLVWERRG
jgi:hypothetical protein